MALIGFADVPEMYPGHRTVSRPTDEPMNRSEKDLCGPWNHRNSERSHLDPPAVRKARGEALGEEQFRHWVSTNENQGLHAHDGHVPKSLW